MGRAVAQELCRCGIQVFVADVDLAAAGKTVQAAESFTGQAEAHRVDVSNSSSVESLFAGLKQRVESLDLLVHAAAILGQTVFIEQMEDQEWRQMMTVNLDGAFYCCREAVRWMKPHKTGRIILFSSVASLTPTPCSIH